MQKQHTVLYVNLYKDSNPARQRELDYCIRTNAELKSIDKICAIVDSLEPYAKWAQQYPKIELFRLNSRPTYRDFFIIANQTQSSNDQINIIANTDIVFTQTLDLLRTFQWKNFFICLTRNDFIDSHLSQCAQDSWMWKGPMRIPSKCDIKLGVPGCDNAIAYAVTTAGYKLHNPAKSIVSIHIHASNIRNYSESSRVTEPYCTIPVSRLGETASDVSRRPNSKLRALSRSKSRSNSRSRSMSVVINTTTSSTQKIRSSSVVISSKRSPSVVITAKRSTSIHHPSHAPTKPKHQSTIRPKVVQVSRSGTSNTSRKYKHNILKRKNIATTRSTRTRRRFQSSAHLKRLAKHK